MDTLATLALIEASMNAGFRPEESVILLKMIFEGKLTASLLAIAGSTDQVWVIERANVWPPQNWLLAEWLEVHRGVING